ncbi:MAG: hypothetical protein ACOX6T_16910 [Myxococcales bacterium]|jgi:hypothetical protein
MNRYAAIALSLLIPTLAHGQEAEKFDAARLQKDFAPMAVFHEKGKVVDNEAIVTKDDSRDSLHAVYLVKAKLEKVVAFYKEKLGVEPKVEGSEELGTLKYVFTLPPKSANERIYKATIEPTTQAGRLQISLLRRALTDEEREDLE